MPLYYINIPSPCHLCSYKQAGLCVEVLPEVCCLKENKLLVIKLHLELMKFSIQHIFMYWFDLLAFYADNWAARNLIHVATLNWFNNFEIRYLILSFIFFALLPEIWSKMSEYSNWHLQGKVEILCLEHSMRVLIHCWTWKHRIKSSRNSSLRDETEEIKENTVCNGIQWWWIIYLYL